MFLRIFAVGDHNCAYNAFVLGLLDCAQQGLLDKKRTTRTNILALLQRTKSFNHILSWANFKEWLTQTARLDELVTLQEESAAILRHLVADQLMKNIAGYAPLLIEEAVIAFTDEVELAFDMVLKTENLDYQFFTEHKSIQYIYRDIQQKYDFVAQPSTLNIAVKEVRSQLTNLFQDGSCKEFCDEISDNNTQIMGNRLVLFLLANFFGIDVFVKENDLPAYSLNSKFSARKAGSNSGQPKLPTMQLLFVKAGYFDLLTHNEWFSAFYPASVDNNSTDNSNNHNQKIIPAPQLRRFYAKQLKTPYLTFPVPASRVDECCWCIPLPSSTKRLNINFCDQRNVERAYKILAHEECKLIDRLDNCDNMLSNSSLVTAVLVGLLTAIQVIYKGVVSGGVSNHVTMDNSTTLSVMNGTIALNNTYLENAVKQGGNTFAFDISIAYLAAFIAITAGIVECMNRNIKLTAKKSRQSIEQFVSFMNHQNKIVDDNIIKYNSKKVDNMLAWLQTSQSADVSIELSKMNLPNLDDDFNDEEDLALLQGRKCCC